MALNHISVAGSVVMLHYSTETIPCYPNGSGIWLPSRAPKGGTTTPVDPEPTPEPDTPPATGTGKWAHPLPGASITSPYGYRPEFHAGVDMSTVAGMGAGGMILAAADMKITVAREAGTGGFDQAGTYVKGHTTSGTAYTLSHFHGHPGTLQVRAGQVVAAGTPLMREGASGRVSGTHLHLEIWTGHKGTASADPVGEGPWYWGDGTPVEPLTVLRSNGVKI